MGQSSREELSGVQLSEGKISSGANVLEPVLNIKLALRNVIKQEC